jgi:hypothetical protein
VDLTDCVGVATFDVAAAYFSACATLPLVLRRRHEARTVTRRLPVIVKPEVRQALSTACADRAGLGPASLVLYDVSVRPEQESGSWGQPGRVDDRVGGSNPDKAATGQHCQMARARRALAKRYTRGTGVIACLDERTASNLTLIARASASTCPQGAQVLWIGTPRSDHRAACRACRGVSPYIFLWAAAKLPRWVNPQRCAMEATVLWEASAERRSRWARRSRTRRR